MNDLISRESLYKRAIDLEAHALGYIEKLNERDPGEYSEDWKIWSAILVERIAFKHMVADAPTIEEWISCSEHQPIEDDEYLVTWRGTVGDHGISHRIFSVTGLFILEHTEKDGWNTDDIKELGYEDIEILAWRPLPELYKEAENGE